MVRFNILWHLKRDVEILGFLLCALNLNIPYTTLVYDNYILSFLTNRDFVVVVQSSEVIILFTQFICIISI